MRSTKVIININNFLDNLKNIKKRIGKEIKICMALKADGYGHGAEALSKAAFSSGYADYAGIAAISEGVQLRESGIKEDILLLSLALGEEVPELFDYNITPFTADISYLSDIAKEAAKRNSVKTVHLKIDTGMNRIGCRPEDGVKIAQFIAENKNLKLGGICTHFPVSDTLNSSDKEFTLNQIKILNYVVKNIREKKIEPGIIHAANSGGILHYPESYFNMVRPGIILFGSYPDASSEKNIEIKPVMTFESRVVFIKKIKKGEKASYGLTWEANEDTFIATIPVGYADGYNRLLSNKGKVEIKGKIYSVAGRVCMDQTLINIGSSHNIEVGDKVILFGGGSSITCDSVAKLCDTISYELYCNINKRVPRICV
ncbi:MAG: alanine racemase [Spirochaetaceae bacterium]|nr:alanine racemase [Spirochaetaceae bacterium]